MEICKWKYKYHKCFNKLNYNNRESIKIINTFLKYPFLVIKYVNVKL